MPHPDISWLTHRPIAHRGLHDAERGRVENCRQSFDAAIQKGYSIELDVQLTADGRAAVFHDYELARLTHGKGFVDGHTMAELSALIFRRGPDQIEALEAVLARVAGRVPLIIELKTPRKTHGTLEKEVAKALTSYEGKAAVMSFSPQIVERLIPLTDRPRGIVSRIYAGSDDGEGMSHEEQYHLTHMLHAKQTRPDFISYCQADFPAPSVALLKNLLDLPVICWTTKSQEAHERALKYCDQVTFEGYNPDPIS